MSRVDAGEEPEGLREGEVGGEETRQRTFSPESTKSAKPTWRSALTMTMLCCLCCRMRTQAETVNWEVGSSRGTSRLTTLFASALAPSKVSTWPG